MKVGFRQWLVSVVALLALTAPLTAQQPGQPKPASPRTLLFPADKAKVPPALAPIVTELLSPARKPVDPNDARPAGVFVRVVARDHILDGAMLKDGGWLGARPFTFLALPEALYMDRLLDVFANIGYGADDIFRVSLKQTETVAVVFRYGPGVPLHEGRDGKLAADWTGAVYPSTWDNVFALVDRMASEADWHKICADSAPAFTPAKLVLHSAKERYFVMGFPDAGKLRIKATPYAALRDLGGADWVYRAFLERTLSVSPHFTGDGTSRPMSLITPPKAPGFPEFLGPNRPLKSLPAVAVIGLGCIKIVE
jgi:hypothetical protein